ncbi:MAG TPA: DnaB-like helicase C-terminal domain-containing protein, partial [Burkholderiaceae bacterium]|nr:DnaB-like helicase C-terminal domain-containing protein [Burkholderiaceae bacterium]
RAAGGDGRVAGRQAETDKRTAKQRNGPIGTVRLTFLGEYTKFENFAAPGSY